MRPKKSQPIDRRMFLKQALTTAGALTLAACNAPQASSTQTKAANSTPPSSSSAANSAPAVIVSPDQVAITVWFWHDIAEDLVNAFNKSQNKIVAKHVKPGGDAAAKLLTAIAAGAGAPDVAPIEISNIGSFTAKGGLTDLRDAHFGADQFKDDFVAYKWAQGTTSDGRLIAMPWDIGPAGIWYRTDLFQQAGLETDPDKLHAQIKTWDDWIQLGEDLRKKLPNTALFADAFMDIFQPIVEQQGHGWFDGNKVLIMEKATTALQKAMDARNRKVDANITWWGPEWTPAIKRDAFATLSVASWMQGGMTTEQPQTVGKWHVMRAPGGDYNWGGSFMAIPEQSQQKEAAWEFIKFACATAQGQNGMFKQAGLFPAYKPAWTDPFYDEPVDFYGGQRAYRLYAEIANNVPAVTVNPNDRQANDIVNNEITKVSKEGKDPVQAAQDAEQAVLQAVPGTTA